MLVTSSQNTKTTDAATALATSRASQILLASKRFFENINLLPPYIYFYKSKQTFGDYLVSSEFSMNSVAEYKLITTQGSGTAYFRLLGADYPGFPSKIPVNSGNFAVS